MAIQSSATDNDSFVSSLEAVVFDFDGTIANTFPMFLAVFTKEIEKNFVIRQETIHDLLTQVFLLEADDPEKERTRPQILLLKVFYRSCRQLGMNKFSALFRSLYSAYQIRKQYDEIELFAGVKELLEELHNQGKILILVTHSSKKSVLKILEKYDLHLIFNIILDRNDIGSNKAKGILNALEALGIEPERSLAIGDLPADIVEAKSVGVKTTVAVPTGLVDKNRLLAVKPDLIIESLSDLKDYLE
ncbi:MAG: HAD family hydrolase [Candidatus Thorarchaeota archaeon]